MYSIEYNEAGRTAAPPFLLDAAENKINVMNEEKNPFFPKVNCFDPDLFYNVQKSECTYYTHNYDKTR